MSIVAMKYLNRLRLRTLKPVIQNVSRMFEDDSSKSGPCSGKSDSKASEPCPGNKDTKQADASNKAADCQKPLGVVCSSCPPPPEKTEPPLPDAPPCPLVPQCPPSVCPPYQDPNNPCNYTPPPCFDPNEPNLVKLKKNQCFLQTNGEDIPIYIKKGSSDAFIYQLSILLTIIGLLCAFYSTFKISKNA